VSPVVTLAIAVGGWAVAFYTLRRNEARDAEKRAEDRALAEQRFQQEARRADERLRAERQEAQQLRKERRDAENGARIESFLVEALEYFESGRGSRDRMLGVAFIEEYWPGFPRLHSIWTSVLIGQVLRLLSNATDTAGDLQDVVALRRMVALLRRAATEAHTPDRPQSLLTSDDRNSLTSGVAALSRPVPAVLEDVVKEIQALTALPVPGPAAATAVAKKLSASTEDGATQTLDRSPPMQERFARLTAALAEGGPDSPDVSRLITEIEAMFPAQAPTARGAREAARLSRGQAPDLGAVPATEDAATARVVARTAFDKELAALTAYTEGKMKRYGLLFSVNGGAFAIAKILTDRATVSPLQPVLGGLQFWHLAVGASAFTVVMCCDIWKYGEMVRESYFPRAFGPVGRVVLCAMGALLTAGWCLAAFW
jgi:hypothetical protein